MAEDSEKTKLSFTTENLEDALRAITSLVSKCEKAQLTVKERTAQSTLLTNRIEALHIAESLISKELKMQTSKIHHEK